MMKKTIAASYEKFRDDGNALLDTIYTTGCTSHFHHQTEILWVKKGTVTVRINDSEQILSEGDVSIADSYDIHSYELNDQTYDEGFVVIISKICLPDAAAYSGKTFAGNFVSRDNAQPVHDLLSVLETNHKTAGNLFKLGLCQAVLGAFYDLLPVMQKNKNSNSFLMREVLIYLHNNYKENITLEMLSKKFGYTSTHFSRIFNSFIPAGLKDYLNKIRAEQAAVLIKNGNTAAGAAIACGFMSIETFYRAFKKRFGSTPKEYLEKHENTSEPPISNEQPY